MRFLVRWMFRLLILLIVLVTALVLLKDVLLKEVVEARIPAQTGLEAKLDRFELGILNPTLTMEGLRLYNPPEYGGSPFLIIPEIHVEYDREALARNQLHIRLLRFQLAEVDIVSSGGRSNIEFIQSSLAKRLTKEGKKTELNFTGIDTLNLSLGKVKTYDLKEPQKATVVDLGVRNQVFNNVKTEKDLYGILGSVALRVGVQQFFGTSAVFTQGTNTPPPNRPNPALLSTNRPR